MQKNSNGDSLKFLILSFPVHNKNIISSARWRQNKPEKISGISRIHRLLFVPKTECLDAVLIVYATKEMQVASKALALLVRHKGDSPLVQCKTYYNLANCNIVRINHISKPLKIFQIIDNESLGNSYRLINKT